MNREAEREMFEANPPQPGLDRFEREYHPNNMHAQTPHHRLLEQLTDRAAAIRAGDGVTADMLEAVGAWLTLYRRREARVLGDLCVARQEIYRLQTKLAACCRTSPDATTRDGEEPSIPEAL